MAKLSANGTEIVRYEVTRRHDGVVRQYSLRSNGALMVKTQISSGWTGWKHHGAARRTSPIPAAQLHDALAMVGNVKEIS